MGFAMVLESMWMGEGKGGAVVGGGTDGGYGQRLYIPAVLTGSRGARLPAFHIGSAISQHCCCGPVTYPSRCQFPSSVKWRHSGARTQRSSGT